MIVSKPPLVQRRQQTAQVKKVTQNKEEEFKAKLLRLIGAYFLGILIGSIPLGVFAYFVEPPAGGGAWAALIFVYYICCMVGTYRLLGKDWSRFGRKSA